MSSNKDYKALAEQYNQKDYKSLAERYNTEDNLEPQSLPETPGKLESFLRGGAQGLTFGLADELAGAMTNPIGAAQQVGKYLHLSDANSPEAEEYRESRDESRKAYEEAEQAHGGYNLAGNLTGALLPALLTLGGSSAATGASLAPEAAELAGAGAKAAEAAGLGTKMWQGAKAGTGAGAAFGVGQDTGDQLSARDVIRNATIGGVTGAALPIAGEAVGGLHDLLKGKSATYDRLSDILKETAIQGKQLAGQKAEKANRETIGSSQKLLQRVLKSAQNKTGKELAAAQSELSPLDISKEISGVKKGITDLGKAIPINPASAEDILASKQNLQNLTNTAESVVNQNAEIIKPLQAELDNLRASKLNKAREVRFSPDPHVQNEYDMMLQRESELSNKISNLENQSKSVVNQKNIAASDLYTKQNPNTDLIFSKGNSLELDAPTALKEMDKIERLYSGRDLSPKEQIEVDRWIKGLTFGKEALDNPEVISKLGNLQKTVRGNWTDAVTNANQKYSDLKTIEDLILNPEDVYRAKGIKAKNVDISKAERLAKAGVSGEKERYMYDIANELAQGTDTPLVQKALDRVREASKIKYHSELINSPRWHENLPEKIVDATGESLHSIKQLPGQAIDKILDTKYAGPVLKKLDEIALQNKYSQTIIDTVKKNLSLQDQNKRKAAINIMMQSPTYRRLVKEIAGVEDGEQVK